MRVAVIGSRSFDDYPTLVKHLDSLKISCIVSGGARGADKMAEIYAKERGIPTQIFPADWDTYGKKAGFIRNRDIVENCDLLVAFWDGESKGTKNSISIAKRINKRIMVIKFYKLCESHLENFLKA